MPMAMLIRQALVGASNAKLHHRSLQAVPCALIQKRSKCKRVGTLPRQNLEYLLIVGMKTFFRNFATLNSYHKQLRETLLKISIHWSFVKQVENCLF